MTYSFDRLHCEMYPNEKLLKPTLLMELREVVIHASAGGNSVWLLLRDVKSTIQRLLPRTCRSHLSMVMNYPRYWI